MKRIIKCNYYDIVDEITESEESQVAQTCREIHDEATSILERKYDLINPIFYASKEISKSNGKVSCRMVLDQLLEPTEFVVTWSYRRGQLVLNGSVEAYGETLAQIYADDYGMSPNSI